MTNPLLNRRELAASRTNEGSSDTPAPIAPVSGDDMAAYAAITHAHLTDVAGLLRKLLQAEQAPGTVRLCVTNNDPPETIVHNFPVEGATRLVVRRTGSGGTIPIAATTPVKVATASDSRLGGYIVNAGATAVTLSLTDNPTAPQAGVPQIYLPPNGSWDFRLSGIVWQGDVTAYSTGTSTVTVAEV